MTMAMGAIEGEASTTKATPGDPISSFDNLPASKPAPRRAKSDPVFGVGWHVFVNWPQLAGQPAPPVPLTDAGGKQLANDLVDGQEVEILSWSPRAREGLAYQIRRVTDGTEWWIAAVYLRRVRAGAAVRTADADRPRALSIVERQARWSKP
jgi:hypothetical protein